MQSQADSTRSFSDDQITLLGIVQVLRSYRLTIMAVVGAAVILSVGVAFLLPAVYDAKVVIVEVSTSDSRAKSSSLLNQFGGLGSLIGIDLGSMGPTQTGGMTVLQSRAILEEFIQQRDLMPTVLDDYWDESGDKWDPSLGREPELWEAAETLRESVKLEADKEIPDLLTLTVEWTDPESAATWANELVALANQLTRQHDIAEAEKSIEYLNDQIKQTQVIELQQVLYNLLQSEQERLMLANAREEYAFKVIDPAVVAVEPARPRKPEVIALGTFFGVISALFLVFLLRVIADLREQERLSESE